MAGADQRLRRPPQRKGPVVLGVLGAQVPLGLLLQAIPAMLAAFGLVPGPDKATA